VPKDKILYFNQLFQQEKNSKKVNLTIGAYRDENGKPWNLPSVNGALERIQK
jgi:aspartate aminotransferase